MHFIIVHLSIIDGFCTYLSDILSGLSCYCRWNRGMIEQTECFNFAILHFLNDLHDVLGFNFSHVLGRWIEDTQFVHYITKCVNKQNVVLNGPHGHGHGLILIYCIKKELIVRGYRKVKIRTKIGLNYEWKFQALLRFFHVYIWRSNISSSI